MGRGERVPDCKTDEYLMDLTRGDVIIRMSKERKSNRHNFKQKAKVLAQTKEMKKHGPKDTILRTAYCPKAKKWVTQQLFSDGWLCLH